MENKNLFVWLLVLVAFVSVISLAVTMSNNIDEELLTEQIAKKVINELNVPSAAEIAALVPVAVLPEIVIPEAKEINSDRLDDLWKNLYNNEIAELESEAYNIVLEEFEDKDYELLVEWLEANIEGFDELEDVDVEDYEVSIIELGLDLDEDKSAEVVLEIELKYSLKEGVDDNFKKDVIVKANVVFDEGDYSDEKVVFVFE